MNKDKQKYIDNDEFREFVSREFDAVAVEATVEEMAEFAFGSVEDAIYQFRDKLPRHTP
jgi:thioredoxin-related protein